MRNYIIGISIFFIVIFIIALALGQADDSVDDIEYPYPILSSVESSDAQIIESPGALEVLNVEESVAEEPVDLDYEESMSSQSFGNTAIEIPRTITVTSEQILKRISYTTSYNKDTKCPNWVAWHLTDEHTDGPFPRSGEPYFENDEACGIGKVDKNIWKGDYFVDMEVELPRQEHSDWAEKPAGMSHGHICPAGDNKWSKAAMNQSFLLTNMCPQDETLNSGGWRKLEEKCRDWAKKYKDIYIVSGPIFYEDVRRSFGKNKIGIPDAFFKVVLCVNGKPKAIGFIYSNDGTSQSMAKNVHSVNEIEEIVGMDFFYYLPDSIENKVEAMTNLGMW